MAARCASVGKFPCEVPRTAWEDEIAAFVVWSINTAPVFLILYVHFNIC